MIPVWILALVGFLVCCLYVIGVTGYLTYLDAKGRSLSTVHLKWWYRLGEWAYWGSYTFCAILVIAVFIPS